jgi:SAM-dependent methyltransferase
MTNPTLDFTAIKGAQQEMWASGDFAAIGVPLQIVGETLCEAVDIRAGSKVLDIACGNGNASLAAARRFCSVIGLDYVPALLESGRERARAERADVTFIEGDAEALPLTDASVDVVLSTFGVMFAPNQEQAASEMLRVCRPGGRIGLANWTPEGFIGEMFRCVARFKPPPAGLASPLRWGTEDGLRELLGDGIRDLQVERRQFTMRYTSAETWLEFFRPRFGPFVTAFGSLDQAGQEALAAELIELARRGNRAGPETLIVPGEYLEVVATRA